MPDETIDACRNIIHVQIQLKPLWDNKMQKTLIIIFVMALAGCSSSRVEPILEYGIVQENSYIYKVSATRSNGLPTDLEDANQEVHAKAMDFCAKEDRVVEIDSLARFEEDYGRPASATLRFRCVKSDKPESDKTESPQKSPG